MTKILDDKFHCELSIKTGDMDVDIITKSLEMIPHRFFNKGDMVISKYSDYPAIKQSGLWALSTKNYSNKLISLNDHIKVLQNTLNDKIDIIIKLKKQYSFEIGLWLRVESKDCVVGFDISKEQMSFINKLCDWTAFGIRCNQKLLK